MKKNKKQNYVIKSKEKIRDEIFRENEMRRKNNHKNSLL